MKRIVLALTFCSICVAPPAGWAQAAKMPAALAPTPVPALVPFAGIAADSQGKPPGETVAITFQIYKEQQGGEPLWQETQTIGLDGAGHYQAELGAASPNGIPMGLFGTGEARWLEVRLAGLPAQPRVLLASVPYALKAADAETLAGRAAGDYVTREELRSAAASGAQAGAAANPETSPAPVTGAGTNGFVPIWTGAATLGNSMINLRGTNVGIGATAPVYPLDVNGMAVVRGGLKAESNAGATATAGVNSPPLEFQANTFSSTASASLPQYFIWQALSSGNNTASPAANLVLSANSGAASPKPTGFSFSSTGLVTFALGQTFPGTGTITGITPASPITGGGASGTVSLGLDPVALATILNPTYAQLGA